ncbi:MAG: FkbM family methyltransferase [Hyphomonadaceae bacterium]
MDEFLRRRVDERAWAYANGFNNGDPETNGEFACLDMLAREADAFVDVGANEGDFIARAARANPTLRIMAFEPNQAHAAILRERLPAGGRLEAVALSDTAGFADLHVHARHHATASLSARPRMSKRFQAEMRALRVPVRRLDDYAGALPADAALLLKIDAEGFEFPVLRGAAAMLERAERCAVMFEFSFAWLETNEALLGCFQFLDERGFDFHRILPLGLEHLRFYSAEMDRAQYCNYAAVKGFALPAGVEAASPYGRNMVHPFPR